ncbi:TM2 domain-containing protein [Mycoplasma zalophidermidis]|uniref:TM2 domain-containing protein n=1 Tax=Mycoplasma zalophidermidis TaxID=398174 RepID=UPI001FE9155A|nr:TM2 domain-containing protein [Mycoplasma zalophidermidis]MCR8966496.1 TM2 domain-containing protein [Mycoplasma zalophidermidis]
MNEINQTSFRSRTALVILSTFFGFLGMDRIYAGRVWLGIFKLLTGGWFGIGAIIDWFLAIFGGMKDSERKFIRKW